MIDREAFKEELKLVALRIPAKECGKMLKELTNHLLNMPRLRNIVEDPQAKANETKLLLLSDKVKSMDLAELPEDVRAQVKAGGYEATSHTLELGYDYFNADHILRKLLPANIDVPSSYEQVGKLIHLNLRDEQLPYKHLIGEVLLDKQKGGRIKTVVNKTSSIENEFRVLPLEVIAGDPDLETEVREQGCTFRFNYADVYWNSRLETEHTRLVQSFAPKDVICDMFAGVGPFAVPAGKRGCTVHANDLNPRSYHYLVANSKTNKVANKVHGYNMDARAFLRAMAAGELPCGAIHFEHIVMNLPASAIEFLDSMRGAFLKQRAFWEGRPLPRVHVYAFTRALDAPKEDLVKRAEAAMGGPLDGPAEAHDVRDVAPNKRMFCLSFRLPAAVAFAQDGYTFPDGVAQADGEGDPPAKRPKPDGEAS
eukprot:tig00001001_g6201.t1